MIESYNFEIHFKNNTIGIVEDIINPAVTFLNIKNKILETIDKINLISIEKFRRKDYK